MLIKIACPVAILSKGNANFAEPKDIAAKKGRLLKMAVMEHSVVKTNIFVSLNQKVESLFPLILNYKQLIA